MDLIDIDFGVSRAINGCSVIIVVVVAQVAGEYYKEQDRGGQPA